VSDTAESAVSSQSNVRAAPEPRLGQVAVSAVMPCLNEEKTLGICIQKCFQSFAELGLEGEVVVADNGSTDRSIEIARSHGARVVSESVKGYGAALRRGITEARAEIIVMADADDSYDWSAIAPFVRKIQEGFDLVMGNRFKGGIAPGAMPALHRYLGNPVLSKIASMAFEVPIGDFHCGMRAFTKRAFERMKVRTTGMEFATEMVANAACQGLRIGEIPTRLYPDKRGRPPHLRSFRDGWRHLRFILTYAPDYLYFGPAVTLMTVGFALMLLLAKGPILVRGHYLGIHFLALGSALTLVGFNVFNLGLLAKTMMARRYEGLRSALVDWVRGRFTLEIGLIAGATLVVLGLAADTAILVTWLKRLGGPMEETVHFAFVASTVVVLGLNMLFSSFLLSMLVKEE
jgi:glycosyltransferase involved in cell wall biosynthesis